MKLWIFYGHYLKQGTEDNETQMLSLVIFPLPCTFNGAWKFISLSYWLYAYYINISPIVSCI